MTWGRKTLVCCVTLTSHGLQIQQYKAAHCVPNTCYGNCCTCLCLIDIQHNYWEHADLAWHLLKQHQQQDKALATKTAESQESQAKVSLRILVHLAVGLQYHAQ